MSLDILTGTIENATSTMVTVEPATVQTVFTTDKALDPLIEKIARVVREHQPDVTTAKGRKEIASLAFRVAKTKTYLDELGKDLVTKYKEMPKKIDANRLDMRTRLDALRDEARKPLDVWEAEQVAVEAKRKADEEAAALALQIEHNHEFALLMDAEFNRKREEAKQAAEQAKRDHEEQIRREAEAKARREAEDRAQEERAANLRRELEAKLALERAEKEKVDAEIRAKEAEERRIREQKEAEEKAERERFEATEREEQARKEATEKERRRQEVEKLKEDLERKAREEDLEHRRTFNQEALEDLRKINIVSGDPTVSILTAIAKKQIRHISIAY
jgi:Holliday junction resolvasome RuvABC endonuclease subunit